MTPARGAVRGSRRRARATLAALVAATIAGCFAPPGDGRIFVPDLAVPDCQARDDERRFEPFDLGLDFFALERFAEDFARIRMQRGGRAITESDGALLDITDREELAARVAAEGSVTLPITETAGGLRVVLYLHATCRGTVPLSVRDGQLRLDAFEPQADGAVRGALSGAVVDSRTGRLLGDQLEVAFDFTVRVGGPYQPFSPF